jgi:general secretion pathway protein D
VDVFLNTSNPNHFSPISITNGTSAYTQGPITGVPGSIGSSATGLNVSASYLDNFQVNLLLRAVQAGQNSSIVHAPRVTMQNGKGATMVQETTIPYVSNLVASVGAGAPSSTPTIGVVFDGVLLSIDNAVVSADHKYVTLDLDPQLNSFGGFTDFTFQSPGNFGTTGNEGTNVNGSGSNTSTGITVVGTTGLASAPEETIQEPKETTTEVLTRVTVPDGGTLLLGGLTIAGEIELQAGVPVLSKIPFLNRLTSNQSMAKDEDVLLILVKPTILIHKEIENAAFPLLTTKQPG